MEHSHWPNSSLKHVQLYFVSCIFFCMSLEEASLLPIWLMYIQFCCFAYSCNPTCTQTWCSWSIFRTAALVMCSQSVQCCPKKERQSTLENSVLESWVNIELIRFGLGLYIGFSKSLHLANIFILLVTLHEWKHLNAFHINMLSSLLSL